MSRRVISGVIHSRACWLDMYSTEGFEPSLDFAASLVSLRARMSCPRVVLPIETTLVSPGLARWVARISSLMPPLPLYGRNTLSAAFCTRASALAPSVRSVSSTPFFSRSSACLPVR